MKLVAASTLALVAGTIAIPLKITTFQRSAAVAEPDTVDSNFAGLASWGELKGKKRGEDTVDYSFTGSENWAELKDKKRGEDTVDYSFTGSEDLAELKD